MVTLDVPCDVQQVDETGHVWAFLDEAPDPSVLVLGAIVVTGHEDQPAFALVLDVAGEGAGRRVHLDVLPGAPSEYLAAAGRAQLR